MDAAEINQRLLDMGLNVSAFLEGTKIAPSTFRTYASKSLTLSPRQQQELFEMLVRLSFQAERLAGELSTTLGANRIAPVPQ